MMHLCLDTGQRTSSSMWVLSVKMVIYDGDASGLVLPLFLNANDTKKYCLACALACDPQLSHSVEQAQPLACLKCSCIWL
eukprot:m.68319 g.68319  ORF g.68319 m.68319 type:complete len:80 (-) comp12192_c0_seq6:286-525(-)